MVELIVEVGMPLTKSLHYYSKMLKKNGLHKIFSCSTHDLYFSKNEDFNNFTEKEIKDSCLRLRNRKEIKNKKKLLLQHGYKLVFDTKKKDIHFCNDNMKSRIQLQKIKNIGLLVYYDNPDYYCYNEDKQRKLLLEELNSYGFTFKSSDLGLDKLRTLYYGKQMFSKNQNK